ncbi:T9SS type A sorting domain-containing protein [Flavobacterium jejuense]|uniref:T9SS type A sorting domain-containing protein n=1 Tax=Flavobacterium jejuense TaxID=1544455 RepID=A0ABX0IP85_9FLAO|nr:T9SS type A sorting domain-containing protein [Flavobacterium jejuense]NHN25386.1 T9SS type A sorting domain-containing protein [Flavobacterium jejuense]
MKKTLFYFLVLLTLDMSAQMYVSPNSYVFVNDTYLYVKQDVNLDNDGNLYLRNKSQLLQGNTSSSLNQGLGNLSVFQEGTSNNFGYNYWCSPVGVPSATVGNASFGITRLNRPTSVVSSSAATILPSSNLNGVSTNSSLSIASRWIYKYVQSNQYGQWTFVGNTSTVNAGEGFTMKGVSGSDSVVADANEGVVNNSGNNQRYDFRGKPNEGTILIPVGNTAGPDYPNQTLTGNPYPSAINLNLFLLENSGYTVNYSDGTYSFTGSPIINGSAYFWEHEKPATSHYVSQYIGGYGVYVPNGTNAFLPGTYTAATWNTYNGDGTPNTTGASTGSSYERMFTPVGQGFMIRGVVASGNAQMKNLYRSFVKEGVASNSQFERSSNSNVNLSNNWEEIPNVANIDYTQFSKKQVPQFKIHTIMNDEFTRETAIAFNDNASDGYDVALDGLTPDSNLPRDMYFPLDTNKQFVISTLPFDVDKKMPIAFKADIQTTFKVTVNELINFDLAQEIFVHDKETNIYYDIKNSFFSITLSPGVYKARFEITFKNTDSTLGLDDEIMESFEVYQNNDNQELTVFNTLQKDVESINLYDVTGKLVINKMNLGTSKQIQVSTSGLSDGVYFVKLTTHDNFNIDKKVSISRK